MPSLAIATAASAAAGLGSALIGSNAATSAAQTQADAATQAAQLQMRMFGKIQGNLAPFMQAGVSALGPLQGLTGTGVGGNPLTARLTAPYGNLPTALTPFSSGQTPLQPFAPTEKWLESTPGYAFTKDQGLKATQNSYAAQGLGQSGAALKGAANYAEGLAGTTFQTQLNNYLQQQQQQFGQQQQIFANKLTGQQQQFGQGQQLFQDFLGQNKQIYDMLSGLTGTGLGAATSTGQFGTQAQTAANQLTTSGAAAQAGGIVGSANAITGGLGTIAQAGQNYALLQALRQGGLFGNTGNQLNGQTMNQAGGFFT